ncbi:MAG: hypothetical protein AAFY19_06165 [Pseudomonadota bacterium]
MTDTIEKHPGEARMKARRRREIMTYIFAGILGGVIGFIVAVADQGDGNLFNGDWDKLVLDPTIAVILAIALLLSLIALPLWLFGLTDELVRERNLIGYTGGSMAVMGGVPAWAVLHAGGLAPEPTAQGAWAIGFFVTMIAFAFAWIRSR